MDLSADWLFATLVLGMIGTGLFLYGKKQARFPQLLAGLALMVFPGFVASVPLMLGLSAALLGGVWLASRAGI